MVTLDGFIPADYTQYHSRSMRPLCLCGLVCTRFREGSWCLGGKQMYLCVLLESFRGWWWSNLSSLWGNSGPLREIFGLILFCQWSTMPTLGSSSTEGCARILCRVTCLMLCPYWKHQNEQLLFSGRLIRLFFEFGAVDGRWLKMYLLLLMALCQLITHNTTQDRWGLLCLCECASKLSLEIWDLYSRCALVNKCATSAILVVDRT